MDRGGAEAPPCFVLARLTFRLGHVRIGATRTRNQAANEMKPRRRRVLLGTTVALALSAIGFAGSAQANSLLPGLNGKIAFTSTRDFPFVLDAPLRGFPQSCQAETNNNSCSL